MADIRARVCRFLRKNTHDGLFSGRRALEMVQGYVVYSDGARSENMPVGNALDYARLFKGHAHLSKDERR